MTNQSKTTGIFQQKKETQPQGESQQKLSVLQASNQVEIKELPSGWVINPKTGEKLDLNGFFETMELHYQGDFSSLNKELLQMADTVASLLEAEECPGLYKDTSIMLIRIIRLFNGLESVKNEA